MKHPISQNDRRKTREPRVIASFGDKAPQALDLLELTELAWHDCYAEISPPEDVVDDILTLADGNLGELISAARLAVTDWRDLKVAAQAKRAKP